MEEQLIKFLDKVFVLSAVLVVGVLVFFVGQMMYENKALDQQNQNQITVSGEGKIYAKPDVAVVSFGVTTQGATVADVTGSNTTKMNAVIAAIKKLGVADNDIQTTNYNLSPVYTNSGGPIAMPMMYPATGIVTKPVFNGYTLEQDVQVKIRDFTKVGDILSQATSSGANVVGNLQFTIDNPEQFREQARAQAIAQAKSNAANLAKESGVNLGKIINVYENNYVTPGVYNSAVKMGAGGADSVPVPTVQPGQQEVDVTINLTYQVQ